MNRSCGFLPSRMPFYQPINERLWWPRSINLSKRWVRKYLIRGELTMILLWNCRISHCWVDLHPDWSLTTEGNFHWQPPKTPLSIPPLQPPQLIQLKNSGLWSSDSPRSARKRFRVLSRSIPTVKKRMHGRRTCKRERIRVRSRKQRMDFLVSWYPQLSMDRGRFRKSWASLKRHTLVQLVRTFLLV